jgi:hypothetical protein
MILSAFSHVGFRVRVHTAVCQLTIDLFKILQDLDAWRHENLGSLVDRSYFELLSQRKKLMRQSEGDLQELLEVFEGPGATLTKADELKRIAQRTRTLRFNEEDGAVTDIPFRFNQQISCSPTRSAS